MTFPFQKYWLIPAITLLLQACGGGSDGGDGWTPSSNSRPAAATVVSLLPGAAQHDLLTVQAVDFPDRDLPEASFSGAVATLQLPDDLADQLLTLRIGKVNESARLAAQQEGTTVDTPQGSPATHYGHLLLTGRQLQQFGAPEGQEDAYNKQVGDLQAQLAALEGGGKKTPVRTGTQNGRKVVQYSDGSIEYAD